MLTSKIKINSKVISDGYLSIPLTSNFSPKTRQYEDVERNFDLTTSDIINPTIDLEKVKLVPIDSDQMQLADSLTFKLHFLNDTGWDTGSTNLSSIGFTEDDVKSRRQRLEKTFIRLSFYDSQDLKTQNLLFFSTIFVNASELYSEYTNSGFTNLKTEFFVQNPKLSPKIKSFEGFNIYLFGGDVVKSSTKTIYMRADFNNAMNGRSTLFTKGKPDSISGYTMQELYANLFFEIDCVFDNSINNYVYSFHNINTTSYSDLIDANVKNTLIIDLYQAKVI